VRVATAAGLLRLHIQPDGQVAVDMGQPGWSRPKFPFSPPNALRAIRSPPMA
jgi:diaminopimelate epimerase